MKNKSHATSSESNLTKNGLELRPVTENESGQGLPYAPTDWPDPGDVWGWKVGNRANVTGCWQDRYLYLPTRLRKPLQKGVFPSRPAVQRYIDKEFPGADADAFFNSFCWRIPATTDGLRNLVQGETGISAIKCMKKKSEHSRSELKIEIVDCKAGNWMCRLQLKARNYALPAMECDICCAETGFCRDCCCILCCKIVDWAFGAYSFVRCEANINGSYICGHVAHIDCALRSYMAGTVGETSELDVEYYCRRCDKKSDLIPHVSRLLQTCESLESRDEIEKILNVGLSILGGSQQERSKRLLHSIELALSKLKSGNCLGDVWKLEDNKEVLLAGEITRSGSNGSLYETRDLTINQKQKNLVKRRKLDTTQQTQRAIASKHRIESQSSNLEENIERALRGMRDSQEYEVRIAKERLCAQKDFILGMYQQLEAERSELVKHTSSSTECNYDTLITNVTSKVNQIKREVLKFKDMKEVAKGFGRVPKFILKESFGMQIAD